MNLKRIDTTLKAYENKLDEQDNARLRLFRGLWELQEQHAALVSKGASYEVPEVATAEEWYWQEKPFFLMAPVKVDAESLIKALEDITQYLLDHAELIEAEAEKLRSLDWKGLVSQSDIQQAGYDPLAYIESCCELAQNEEGAPDSAMVTLVLTYALRPMLQDAAAAVMKSLAPALKTDNTLHDKPLCCPACGSGAIAAFVGETPSSDGQGRLLHCGTCGTEWEFERIRCAQCGTRNQGHLHYFHIEGDEAHRLHNCQECGDYTRTVFQEKLEVPFSFEVEDVVMARLDMVANDPRFSEDTVVDR